VLGPAAVSIAQWVDPALRRIALPVMERLCADVGETVLLQVIDADQAAILTQVIGRYQVVRVNTT